MSFKQSFSDVIKEAKEAFEDIERTKHEKYGIKERVLKLKPYKKKVGFVDGTREILAWRQ